MLFGALGLAATLPTGFNVPNTGIAYLSIEGPQGATLETMERAVDHVTGAPQNRPDVQRVFAQVGAEGPLFSGHMTVVMNRHRTLKTDEFTRSLTGILREVPDVRISTEGGGFGRVGVEVIFTWQRQCGSGSGQMELLRELRTFPQILKPRPSPSRRPSVARLLATSTSKSQILARSAERHPDRDGVGYPADRWRTGAALP